MAGSTPAPAPPGYVVAANAAAGSSERAAIRAVAGRLAEEAPTELAWTDGDDEFDRVTAGLEGRRLVLAGGDGTFHFALNRLATTGRLQDPVAVVPAGTGNDFARGIGLGADLEAATETVVDGVPRWYASIETSTGELAHNNAHFGLGLVAAERGTEWKPRLGRLAYPVATAVEGVRYDGEPVRLTIGDEVVHDGPALAVLVLLGPSMGGGIELTDDIEIAESTLDVVVVRPPTGAGRAGMALDAVRNRLFEREDVDRWTTTSVTVAATDGVLRGDIDGEISEWHEPLQLAVRPRTWQVVSPR
jgi:diacylglycerol kinase (ATP)